MQSTRRAISLMSAAVTAASFVFVPEVGSAQLPPRECLSRGCPVREPDNGELVGTFGPGGGSVHNAFGPLPDTNRVPFGGTFTFYYGIKRQFARQPGAIAIRVVKVLRQPQPGNQWLDRTLLYRNKFDHASQKDAFDYWIDRPRYQRWHLGENIDSPRLSTEFHVELRADERTSEPLSRRRSFVFEQIPNHHDDTELQKAYILGYRSVRPDGTWIVFTIDFGQPYSDVYVTITDLGIDFDGDPVKWTWRFENSAR